MDTNTTNETWEEQELRVVTQQMLDSISEEFKDPKQTPEEFKREALAFLIERKLVDSEHNTGESALGASLVQIIHTSIQGQS